MSHSQTPPFFQSKGRPARELGVSQTRWAEPLRVPHTHKRLHLKQHVLLHYTTGCNNDTAAALFKPRTLILNGYKWFVGLHKNFLCLFRYYLLPHHIFSDFRSLSTILFLFLSLCPNQSHLNPPLHPSVTLGHFEWHVMIELNRGQATYDVSCTSEISCNRRKESDNCI